MRILIVDDNADLRQAACGILSDHNGLWTCAQAGDGEDAVRKALQLRPDLVILDISMPVLDGFGALRQIREQLPRLPVLMITTNPDPEVIEFSRSAGAQGFLNKHELAESLGPAADALLAGGLFFPNGHR
ncbi:MAG: response regulator transcription factor [Candidatus Acidiferrum sp.]